MDPLHEKPTLQAVTAPPHGPLHLPVNHLVRNTTRQFLDRPKTKPRTIKPAVLNLYEPDPAPATLNASKPMHLYDINSAMPFHLLETDEVRLEPLVVSQLMRDVLVVYMHDSAVQSVAADAVLL